MSLGVAGHHHDYMGQILGSDHLPFQTQLQQAAVETQQTKKYIDIA